MTWYAIVTLLIIVSVCNMYAFKKNLSPEESLQEDMVLSPVEIMNKYKYYGEEHRVQTEDGYILGVHHMLQKEINNGNKPRNYPVFLMHGMASSSFDWLSLGPGKSLPHLLHDLGFDVWLGNARGNIYSRNHINMTTTDPNFWEFSWHQIGYYDVKAMIDYVLHNTSSSKLHYIGHSQGCTSFFVLVTTRPEYNSKIQVMNALAPPVFMGNANFLLKFQSLCKEEFTKVLKNMLVGTKEIPPFSKLQKATLYYICRETSSIKAICEEIFFLIGGKNKQLLNSTFLPLAGSHVPAGISMDQLEHYAQLIKSGRFTQFDYGKKSNMQKYGSETPPEYPLEKVTARIALHYSENDYLVVSKDVEILRPKLSNVVLFRKVPHPEFNHIDFLFAINVTYYLYDSVIEIVTKYDDYVE